MTRRVIDTTESRELSAQEVAALPAPDPLPLPVLFQTRLADLASIRWQKETGGITVSQVPIKTDRETQSIILGAYVKASGDPGFSINYKVGDGQFIPVDAAMITAVGNAVFAHVQACFDHEAELTALLAAAYAAEDAEALAAVDITAGWPV